MARNASTHAAGVVISREPLTELMPLQRATNSDALMTQYEMHGVEALGLLKFDFLGLSNLTILRQAVDLIAHADRASRASTSTASRSTTRRPSSCCPRARRPGVFQLESAGMRRYIRELRPTSVYDLAAMVALFRPGPMDNIPAYIRRKHGQEPVTYLHPLLEPYLEKTYGIFVYQEDIMAAAIALGGFTGPEADTLGYAIRKKKSDVLQAQKGKFVSQAAERGVRAAIIDAVFKAFEPFERYGFNKAHATCYGLIAYQTAYLKANYPVEYMTSVLTAFRDNTEKVAGAVAECRRLGIEVLPPGHPRERAPLHGRGRRHPLRAAGHQERGRGGHRVDRRGARGRRRVPVARRPVRAGRPAPRQQAGPRVARQGRRAVRARPPRAAAAGARRCHRLRPGRAARPRSPARARCSTTWAPTRRSLERPLPPATEAPSRERLRWEKELLGLYLSDHPLGELAAEMGRYVNAWSGGHQARSSTSSASWWAAWSRACAGSSPRARQTMAVATLEDLQGSIEVVVFPKTYEETGADLGGGRRAAGRRAGRPQGRRDGAPGRLGVDLGAGPGAGARRLRGRRRGRGPGPARPPERHRWLERQRGSERQRRWPTPGAARGVAAESTCSRRGPRRGPRCPSDPNRSRWPWSRSCGRCHWCRRCGVAGVTGSIDGHGASGSSATRAR